MHDNNMMHANVYMYAKDKYKTLDKKTEYMYNLPQNF